MSVIVPTVTTNEPHIYRQQIERIAPFAKRVHIDLADGVFAPNRLINPIQSWWPEDMTADLHLMYEDPATQAETVVSLKPDLVVIHAEAVGNLPALIEHWQKFGLKVGISLLQETTPEDAHALIPLVDHVLIFSGDLGHFGGQADLRLLDKIPAIKRLNPEVEIAWDGGISLDNAASLAKAGVDVLNTGGAIQRAEDPAAAYDALASAIS
ncbi:hypothetical protein JNJ66_02950 [Candidatus Saccharibacteria bacterium]|nr:hypothetical protein [Candidatus Saccharibacteria bacterium]